MAELEADARRRIYRILCNVAACDGSVDTSERAVLDSVRARYGLSEAEAQALEAEGVAGDGMQIGEDAAERAALIAGMIDVTVADGRVDANERKRLVQVAKEIGLTRMELQEQLIPRLG